ncbi:MAG: NAD(P)H-dependent oxidoreductase subunit E [Deltaproteobacteria bacterium]|nr:NAD(P)H-dependent oxidoreductase subunit E [Deltaproteobacteria bacterium]
MAEDQFDLARLEPILKKYRGQEGALIPVLQEAQNLYGYLPEEVLVHLSRGLKIPLSRIYGVATFYTLFHLSPPGKYQLELCRSISCALCGSERIFRALEKELQIKRGETTADGLFTIQEVECLATCGMGPVMRLQDVIYENLTPAKARKIVEMLRKKG